MKGLISANLIKMRNRKNIKKDDMKREQDMTMNDNCKETAGKNWIAKMLIYARKRNHTLKEDGGTILRNTVTTRM